jgi:hypothetical protein
MNQNDLSASVAQYMQDGFTTIKVFNEDQTSFLENFAQEWIYGLIEKQSSKIVDRAKYPLEQYHKWWQEYGVDHNELFRASNRYIIPEGELKNILLSESIWRFLRQVQQNDLELWADPGLGWFGFRMVRPGMNDGYPASCKNWGAAAGVISIWLPIKGLSSNETLALVPGSHLRKYEKYLPENSKFTTGEFRLAPTETVVFTRPELKRGEIIFYDSGTLHTENVTDSPITRLNLEYRFMPIKK